MIIQQKNIRRNLHIFVGIIIVLSVIGGIFIYSSSSIYACEKYGTEHYYIVRHIIGIVIGITGMIIIQYIPTHTIQASSPLVMLVSLILTCMTYIPKFARKIHGANRWVHLGSIAFQPSELLKMALIAYVAYILAKKDWSQTSLLHDYIPILLVVVIPLATILAQPDFGLTATLSLTIFLMFFLASFKLSHLLLSFLLLIPAGSLLIFLKPYRLKRILVFLNPWQDPLGSGFQIIQSLIAIGSGGWCGLGIGNSRQKLFYLPMQHTDFVFSVVAEETGLIGTSTILVLYIMLLYYGLRLARNIPYKYASLVIAGFTMLTSLQALINIAVTIGIVPTKGIGLPFISYGNTALVCNLCMVGIVINLVHEYS